MENNCQEHKAIEERIQKQHDNLSSLIYELQAEFIREMNQLSKKTQDIYDTLSGGLSDKIGFVQRVGLIEDSISILNERQNTLNSHLEKILPWFSVFKWSVITVAPLFLAGTVTLFAGLLTGKIKILI